MAIEIASVVPDRQPHADWGAAAPVGRFRIPADSLLRALETAGAPDSTQEGLRRLAAAGADVEVLLAPDRGLVLLVIDGRRIPMTGSARDAVLNLLGETTRGAADAAAAPARSGAAGGLDPSTAVRVAAVGAQIEESRSHAALDPADVVDPEPRRALIVSTQTVLKGSGTEAAAARIASAVEQSGLFLEAHLAQWLRGERSLHAIEDEARALPAENPPGDARAGEARGRAQLDALQHDGVSLSSHAWPGQSFQLEISGDRERHRDRAIAGDAPGVFTATLTLTMPRLGAMRVRIRATAHALGIHVESDQPGVVRGELGKLASALSARGLQLAQLDASPPAVGTV